MNRTQNRAKKSQNQLIDIDTIPKDKYLEMDILGTLLLEPSKIAEISTVTEDDFFFGFHKEVFRTILQLSHAGKYADYVLVLSYLQEFYRTEGKVFDVARYSTLIDGQTKEVQLRFLADRLIELADNRRLMKTGNEIIQKGQTQTTPAEIIKIARETIDSIASKTETQEFSKIGSMVHQKLAELEHLSSSLETDIPGVKTGFNELDEILVSLQQNQLIVLAARPGVGKTSFAMQVAINAAFEGKKIGFFSLEMNKEQLSTRIISNVGEVDSYVLRKIQKFGNRELFQRLLEVSVYVEPLQIFIDDTAGQTISSIKAKARKLKLEKNIDLLIVDYLQLIKGSNPKNGREQEIAEISRNLKELSKELAIPVLALAQLNRKAEERADHKPLLADLRESGAVEQDADIVMFLFREEMYKASESNQGTCDVIIAKNRSGSTDTVKLAFIKQYTKFANLYQESSYAR